MSDRGSWAPFGPSWGDDDDPPAQPPPEPEPEPESEPPPSEPPPPEPQPPSFQPPVPQALPTLPEPSPLSWPAPSDQRAPEPQGTQAPWPPQGFQAPAKVPSNATVALVLGVVSIMFCGLVGPFAIQYGLRARAEIDADPSLGGRGMASWGTGLGIVSTAVFVLLVLLIAVGAFSVT